VATGTAAYPRGRELAPGAGTSLEVGNSGAAAYGAAPAARATPRATA
jgi:hypothetical protein